MINKTLSKLCVPLHGGAHWSVLDVVALPQTGCMNICVKETDYINQNNTHVSGFSATNKVIFPPMWWEKYFGLYAKEKNGVSHSNIYFWLR